ncbi:MAG: hypothetical protein IT382_12520 [Deltaproteobacteria bacterium]|nr:hypothetical protein [Deltaproteobacteria bacterium]
MSAAPALLALALMAAEPAITAPAAAASAPAGSVAPGPLAPPPWSGGALEVLPDGRVTPLGRPAEILAVDPKAGPAVVERVDLVWGCRGDRAKAALLEGAPRATSMGRDACIVRVDVRPPCAPDGDPDAADAEGQLPARAELQRDHQDAQAALRRLHAALAAGYAEWGPGLRLVVSGGGPLTLVSSRLLLEQCGCEGNSARAQGEEVRALALPRLAGPTQVWVRVPRYLGALHRLGPTRPPSPGALSFVDPFQAEDAAAEESWEAPDLDMGDGAPSASAQAEAFSAPAGCDCAPCDTPDGME